jgi:hypothetical protein
MPETVEPITVRDGRIRAVVENVTPRIDDGRFAVKRTAGETFVVEADCCADGHDAIACALLWRREGATQWQVAPMTHVGNDRWRGSFRLDSIGRYRYTVCAWVDHFLSWQHHLARRVDLEDVRVALRTGAQLVAGAAGRTQEAAERDRLQRWAEELARAATGANDVEALRRLALDPALSALAARHPDLQFAYRYPRELPLAVDRERARFSAWYEMFPRSASVEPGRHGTFADCEKLLPYVARFEFWIEQGVKMFRVDNPHTKAFAFWEWAIDRLQAKHPDLIFLSEAFTRPKVMHRLAKLGFTQSYTYFAWRNTKRELTEYFTDLAHGLGREYFRPNVWPNTPDILTEALQFGTRGTFMARVALAATLSANYGIHGPAYELMEQAPREPGSEEYLDSDKYQLRHWNRERPDSLAPFIGVLNRIRRANPALQRDDSLRFLPIENEQMIAYAKSTPDLSNVIVCTVNLDPHHVQSGWLALDLAAFGLQDGQPYQMHDLVTGARYLWHGARNFVSLDPQRCPVHVFRLQRRVHREQDFDYFM